MDAYYSRPEISNSDLSELQKYWLPENKFIDLEKAYADGTLIDCMITEPHKVDYFKYRVVDYPYQFSADDFARSCEMKKAFYRDGFCSQMVKQCSFQRISIKKDFQIEFEGVKFCLDVRAKWDLWLNGFGGDIKSTACTTQKSFEEAARYFDYPRSRAWYMDIENSTQDFIIGISKVNFKIFKIIVKKGDKFYNEGKRQYQELSFKYWYLFYEIKMLYNGTVVTNTKF